MTESSQSLRRFMVANVERQRLVRGLKKRADHRLREVRAYTSALRSVANSGQIRVIIFGQGRTGSTLLESLLCSTGYFERNGEVLRTDLGDILLPTLFVKGLALSSHDNFIAHVKIYHLLHDRRFHVNPHRFLESLENDGWFILYLRRNNILEQALSGMIADQRGSFHKQDDIEEKYNIYVDCGDLIRRVNKRILFDKAEKDALSGIKCHNIVYEEDLQHESCHQRTVNNILDYLALDRRRATTTFRKINCQPVGDVVQNYMEVKQCLSDHGLHKYI